MANNGPFPEALLGLLYLTGNAMQDTWSPMALGWQGTAVPLLDVLDVLEITFTEVRHGLG